MVVVGKLQAEIVFSLFAMLKFGISADIIKSPIGRLMINYMLSLNLNAEWPMHIMLDGVVLAVICWAISIFYYFNFRVSIE